MGEKATWYMEISSIGLEWLLGQSAALVVALCWALLERRERRSCQRQNLELSKACIQIVKENSEERVRTEERHMLTFDSSMRNFLASLERAATAKQKPSAD